MQKPKPIRSKALRDLARGQTCTVQIQGICNCDPTTTVLAHLPDESKGMGRKADDISACFACSNCHDVLDGRVGTSDYISSNLSWFMRRAMVRTLRIAIEAGVICLKG